MNQASRCRSMAAKLHASAVLEERPAVAGRPARLKVFSHRLVLYTRKAIAVLLRAWACVLFGICSATAVERNTAAGPLLEGLGPIVVAIVFCCVVLIGAVLFLKRMRSKCRFLQSAAILEAVGDAVLVVDAESLLVTYVGAGTERLFAKAKGDIVGKTAVSLLQSDSSEDILRNMLDAGNLVIGITREDVDDAARTLPLEGNVTISMLNGREVFVISFRDLSHRIAYEKELRSSEQRYRSFFENTGTATAIVDQLGMIIQVNSEFESMSGRSRFELVGKIPFSSLVSGDLQKVINALGTSCTNREGNTCIKTEFEIADKDGELRQVWATVSCIPESSSKMLSLMDISSLRSVERVLGEQRAYFERLFEHAPQGIMFIDHEGVIIDANKEFEFLFGYDRKGIIGRKYQDILLTADMRMESKAIFDGIKSGKKVRKETYRKNKSGEIIPVRVLCYPVEINAKISGYFVIYEDISDRKAYEEQLARQAFYDALTDLPNRSLFNERLEWAVQRAARKDEYRFSVFMIDLNRFKWINDSLGHEAGDHVLRDISRRIEGSIRSVDTVSRLGGDEFAVLLEDLDDMEEILHIAERIESNIRQPIIIEGHEIYPSSSIGIVVGAERFGSPKEIMRNADVAMYRAKESAGGYVVYDGNMHKHFLETVRIESDLRKSIGNNELELHYQPIVSVADTSTKGFEALVRWRHPERGLVMPGSFIHVAEQTGLITSIGNWVLEQACCALQNWHCEGAEDLFVSVNISTQQFMKRDLVKDISAILVRTGVNPGKLKLEITESTIMKDAESAVEKLANLKSMGVQVAVDDFGTGYSSLSYLQKFPIDALKIDRTFISGEGDSTANAEIVQAVIALAGNLGLYVVAEGVEEEHQLHRLKNLNCDYAQGFLIAKPMPLREVGPFLLENEFRCNNVLTAAPTFPPCEKHPLQSKFEEDTEPC